MDFKLTDGQEMLKKTVREFAEKVVGPRAEEVDQTGIFPRDTFEQMAKLGLTGIGTPEEYGGSGGNDIDKVITVTELAKKCAEKLNIKVQEGVIRRTSCSFCADRTQCRL